MATTARSERLAALLADRVFDVAFVIGTDGVVTWRRGSGEEPVDFADGSPERVFAMGWVHPEDDDDEDTAEARTVTARLLAALLNGAPPTSTVRLRDRHVRLHARWLGDAEGTGPVAPDDLSTRSDDILISAEDVSPAISALAEQAAAEATFPPPAS